MQTIHTDNVDLSDKSLQVDISDALSEKDKVKFTVHTTTTLPEFQKPDNLVVRQHEEFVWLHDRFEENEEYAGYIVCLSAFFSVLYNCNFPIMDRKNIFFRFLLAHHDQILMHLVKNYKNLERVKVT